MTERTANHIRAANAFWFLYGLIAGMLVGGILIWVTQ